MHQLAIFGAGGNARDVLQIRRCGRRSARAAGLVERLARFPNVLFPTLIDPRAVIGERMELGAGTVVICSAKPRS
jgi:hypothetical protein